MDPIFSHPNPDAASARNGPLRSLKIAIGPNISAAGWPAEAGANALAGFTAVEDSTIVQRLRQAGAALCGPTRISEFGFGLEGSMAGEAVQKRTADAELAMDFMGESRLAASRAGVCGFKPSYGLVSRFGLIDLIPSMECCGILSEDPKIIGDILTAIAGQDGLDFSLPDEEVDLSARRIDPQKTTIGVIAEALNDLAGGQAAAFHSLIDELKKAGFPIKEMSLPDYSLFLPVHKIVGSVEASSCAGRYDSVRYGPRAPGAKNWNDMYLLSRSAAFGPLLKSYLFQGAFFQFERYDAFESACRIRARLISGMQRLASQTDFLIFPAPDPAAPPAESIADIYAQFASTAFANATGQPALFAPPGFHLAGPRLSDARLLALGQHLINMRRKG